MEERVELPEALHKAQRSLEPYIKPRHEISKIRQVLSSHLASQLNVTGGHTRPLSLVDSTCNVDASSHGLKGLQREYVRCVRANLKTRKEYTTVSNQHHEGRTIGSQEAPIQSNGSPGLEAFILLTVQQQKHERLRIIQDYIDVLSQKPAALAEHLNPKVALKDVEALPKVPAEVLNDASNSPMAHGTDLKELVDQLEKSVLRAKMLLQKEQKLLAKVRTNNHVSSANQGDRLQALGLTRNALINWIEAEMEKAGDDAETEDEESPSHDTRGKDYIEAQLASIQRQYGRYIEARELLVNSSAAAPEVPASHSLEEPLEIPELPDSSQFHGMHVLYPYLEKMVSTANEQKATIQQRSHLTISLAKQVKEASQGLDRLADESHLLPAYPLPSSTLQRKGLEGPLTFNDELLHHEKPDSSDRARAWIFAAQSSGTGTKTAVSEQLEVGGNALKESQTSLAGLYQLLGYENTALDKAEFQKKDIWAVLDGSLGVLKGDGVEVK